MHSFRPYKFFVTPVIQELDEEGNVVNELSPEGPTIIFGVEGLHKLADNIELDIAAGPLPVANQPR